MNTKLLFGILILGILLFSCFLIPLFLPYSVLNTDINNAYLPPSLLHPLGTDAVGRDVLLRVLLGGRISLSVGVLTMLIETFIGVTLGMLSGYSKKTVDRIIMNFSDMVLSLPSLAIILILCAVFSDLNTKSVSKIFLISFIIAILSWPTTARMIRAVVLSSKQTDYMKACDIIGLPLLRKIFIHLLPNLAPQITVLATLSTGNAILTESAISFLGLGTTIPYPSWGSMVSSISNRYVFLNCWWVWLPAGILLIFTVLAVNLISEGLFKNR